MADEAGLSRTIPDHSGPFRTRKAAGKGSSGAPGTGQAIGKTRFPKTGAGPGEVEQGGRGRLPARCREPPRAIEANGRGDRRSMTRPFPLSPTIRPRAARKADHGPKSGQSHSRVRLCPPDPGCAGVPPAHPGSSRTSGVGKVPVRAAQPPGHPPPDLLSPAYPGLSRFIPVYHGLSRFISVYPGRFRFIPVHSG